MLTIEHVASIAVCLSNGETRKFLMTFCVLNHDNQKIKTLFFITELLH